MSQKIVYHILSPRNIFATDDLTLKNKCYVAWDKLWESVYAKKNTDFKLKSDEFTRQDLITAILIDDKVAALHFYSFYDLKSFADLNTNYFAFFSSSYLQRMKDRNVRSTMSMEFLTVVPEFRKDLMNGVSLGRVISSLGTRIFAITGMDAIIAPARNDVKVNEMAYDIGFDCLQPSTMQRGFECDLIACFQGNQKPSSDPKVRQIVDQLWTHKTIHPSAKGILDIQKENETSNLERKSA